MSRWLFFQDLGLILQPSSCKKFGSLYTCVGTYSQYVSLQSSKTPEAIQQGAQIISTLEEDSNGVAAKMAPLHCFSPHCIWCTNASICLMVSRGKGRWRKDIILEGLMESCSGPEHVCFYKCFVSIKDTSSLAREVLHDSYVKYHCTVLQDIAVTSLAWLERQILTIISHLERVWDKILGTHFCITPLGLVCRQLFEVHKTIFWRVSYATLQTSLQAATRETQKMALPFFWQCRHYKFLFSNAKAEALASSISATMPAVMQRCSSQCQHLHQR